MTHNLVFIPCVPAKNPGQVGIYQRGGNDWFETIYDANSKELRFFDRRTPHMSENPFEAIQFPVTNPETEMYTGYGPDIPHPEFTL